MAESIDEARKVAVDMTEMVSDLLDVSRLEAGQMPLELSQIDLGALATEVAAMVGRASHRVSVRMEASAEQARIIGDASVIRRVVTNLVGNAVKFSPTSSQIVLLVQGNGTEAKVSVTDRGPGIAPEFHEKIFEKFGQVEAARQGTKHSSGLGLTFCKFAVEAHGGRIGLESVVGRGSTFWFVLPVHGPPALEKKP
jgi:signal transduction histidine kinase